MDADTLLAYLRSCFVYEPEGRLRRVAGGRVPYPWQPAGNRRQYLAHQVSRGPRVYLHRAVWLYHHGAVPPYLDHVDGDTGNNRLENLRPCTLGENQHNSKRKANNKSGAKGVAFCAGYRNPYRARITVRGHVILLGYFATVAEAAAAYADGVRRYAPVFGRADASLEFDKKD